MKGTERQLAIEPLFEAEALRASVEGLGRRLSSEVGGEDPLLLAILGGSVIFLADLVRALELPVRYELIHVEYSEEGPEGPQGSSAESEAPAAPPADLLRIQYPIPIEIEGQSVLLIKDVVASGVIETYLVEQLRNRGARDVHVVALIDLPAERKTQIEVDYRAFSTTRSGVLVGYGMKHRGRYGNLPFIGRLPERS